MKMIGCEILVGPKPLLSTNDSSSIKTFFGHYRRGSTRTNVISLLRKLTQLEIILVRSLFGDVSNALDPVAWYDQVAEKLSKLLEI